MIMSNYNLLENIMMEEDGMVIYLIIKEKK